MLLEYVMLRGVNDSIADAQVSLQLHRPKPCLLNCKQVHSSGLAQSIDHCISSLSHPHQLHPAFQHLP